MGDSLDVVSTNCRDNVFMSATSYVVRHSTLPGVIIHAITCLHTYIFRVVTYLTQAHKKYYAECHLQAETNRHQ